MGIGSWAGEGQGHGWYGCSGKGRIFYLLRK